MFKHKHIFRTFVAAAVIAASLVATTTASAAWQTTSTQGVVGPFDQPHLACTWSGNRLDMTVSDPDVGGRAGPVYHNADGSYTTGWGTGGPQEWVYYQATLYRLDSSGWTLLGQGPWWKTFTGPWKPNVYTTSNWFNVTLGKWDYEIVVPDGAGYYHRLMGGPTTFQNLPAGPRYGIMIEYYWGATSNYGAAAAYSFESVASC
jgi:hypothetical protein